MKLDNIADTISGDRHAVKETRKIKERKTGKLER